MNEQKKFILDISRKKNRWRTYVQIETMRSLETLFISSNRKKRQMKTKKIRLPKDVCMTSSGDLHN